MKNTIEMCFRSQVLTEIISVYHWIIAELMLTSMEKIVYVLPSKKYKLIGKQIIPNGKLINIYLFTIFY